jgi:hypothetical protein
MHIDAHIDPRRDGGAVMMAPAVPDGGQRWASMFG